jgi:hypothetical protein
LKQSSVFLFNICLVVKTQVKLVAKCMREVGFPRFPQKVPAEMCGNGGGIPFCVTSSLRRRTMRMYK